MIVAAGVLASPAAALATGHRSATGHPGARVSDGLRAVGNGGGQVGGPASASPSVTVARNGTAYLAWNEEDGVALCAIPRGTARCRPHAAISNGVNNFMEPPLLGAGRGDALELVTETQRGEAVRLRSRGRAAHFTRVAALGYGQYSSGAFGPSGQVLLSDDQDGLTSLVVAAGAPVQRFADHDRGVMPGSSAAGWSGSTPVIVGDGQRAAYAWHWAGHGSPALGADWARQRLPADELCAMASGPRGLFLAEIEPVVGHRNALTVWRWRGGRFVRVGRVRSTATANALGGLALAQDGRGALVVAWYDRASAAIFGELSTDSGRRFGAPQELAAQVAPMDRMTLAVGPSGHGVLAYDSQYGGVWDAPVSVAAFRTR